LRAIIVLAGGRSSRFGREKALVDFGGKRQVAHIVERLRGLGDEFVASIGRNGAVLAAKAEYAGTT
jgi:molybdopterin-guanine dinucleotide biosynthesis protein A